MSITRRALMIAGGVAGGGLVLGVATMGAWIATYDRRAEQREQLAERGTKLVAQWLMLDSDGHVTILSPHIEMGQGAQTGILQIVLDELSADPARTTVEVAPATRGFTTGDVMAGFLLDDGAMDGFSRRLVDRAFGRAVALGDIQFTGGSTAVRYTGWRGMRRAAAAAREMLIRAAATQLGVDPSTLTTDNGAVVHAASGRTVDYGALAAAAAALPMPAEPTYKPRDQWKYIGTRFPRVDIPDKVLAKAEYGIDVRIDGMRYAAVAAPSLAEGTITAIDNADEVQAMKGVEAVLNLGDMVAVVADKPWRAERAVRAVSQSCAPPPGGVLDSKRLARMREDMVLGGELSRAAARGSGVAEAIEGTDDLVEARYTVPFLAHAPMEPMNATVWEDGDTLHLATGTQDPRSTRIHIANTRGIDVDSVELHPHTIGGAFGRRSGFTPSNYNWVTSAAKIQQQVGGAVKTIWSREAGLRMSHWRPADFAWMRAKLGPDGKPEAWWARHYTTLMAAPEALPLYEHIKNVEVQHNQDPPAIRYAFWRSVDASILGFTIESFMDECARKAGTDPLDYRLSMLESGSRHARLLERVAEMSGWGSTRAEGRAVGCALNECFGSIVAQVAEVSIHAGQPKVHRVWAAVDPGLAINPDSIEAQVQGGIHYGLSAALYGQITIEDGRFVQSNFHDYRVVKFSDAPRVEVAIQETDGAPVGGVGEVGTPGAAPALCNALARLEDERRRVLPVA